MNPRVKCLGLIGPVNDAVIGVYPHTIFGELQKFMGTRRSANMRISCLEAVRLNMWLREEDWESLTAHFIEAGRGLMLAGAEGLVICGSAFNPVGEDVRRALGIPLIDFGMSLEMKLRRGRYRRVAVLGIRTRREERMLLEKLTGIVVLQPSTAERAWINECLDMPHATPSIHVDRRIKMRRIVAALRDKGAQALVLATSALNDWVQSDELSLQPYDAAVIHAWVAALWALESGHSSAPMTTFLE